MRTDKVYLVGFMGAGKTTLARALGARLDWRVEDVDERIETREGRAISNIFAREGEGYFRDVGTPDAYRRAREEWPVQARR